MSSSTGSGAAAARRTPSDGAPGQGTDAAAAELDRHWSDTAAHRLAEPSPSLVDVLGAGTARVIKDNTASSRSGVRGVLRVQPFRRLWIALAFSSLGDWLGLLATTALAVQLGGQVGGQRGQAFALGGVLLVRLLPSLILGPLAGAVADRFDRRVTMVVSDVVRAALYLSIPLVHSLWWLTVATFLAECFGLFWIPAKEASVPNLLTDKEQLEPANQLSLITTYGTAPVAALLYAVLAAFSRALGSVAPFFERNPNALALFADAGTFLYGAWAVVRLTQVGGQTARSADGGRKAVVKGLFRDVGEGVRFVGGTPLVRGIVVGIVGGFAAVGTVAACGRLYVSNLGGGDAAYGLLFGMVFAGLAGGMAFGPRLTRRLARTRVFGLAIAGAGASLAVLSVLPNLLLALGGVVTVGFFAGLAWVTGQTLLGREVEDEVRGRTFAIVQSLVRVTLFAVLGMAPFLVGLIGPHAIVLDNGARIRADGATLVLLAGGLVALGVGVLSFRLLDERHDVSVLGEVMAALRRRPPRLPAYPGIFVAVEGGEGAGKSTQVRLVADWLRAGGREVVTSREPGGTALGARMRDLLLDPQGHVGPRAEALLYAADRAEHVTQVILPALRRGAVVITDRYVDSSLAYQGAGRALGDAEVARLCAWATDGLRPDVTVLLDLDPSAGLGRAAARGSGTDRLEGESLAFHQRVRRRFLELALAEPARYVVVEVAALDMEVVHATVREGLRRVLTDERLWTRPTTALIPVEPEPEPEPESEPEPVGGRR